MLLAQGRCASFTASAIPPSVQAPWAMPSWGWGGLVISTYVPPKRRPKTSTPWEGMFYWRNTAFFCPWVSLGTAGGQGGRGLGSFTSSLFFPWLGHASGQLWHSPLQADGETSPLWVTWFRMTLENPRPGDQDPWWPRSWLSSLWMARDWVLSIPVNSACLIFCSPCCLTSKSV